MIVKASMASSLLSCYEKSEEMRRSEGGEESTGTFCSRFDRNSTDEADRHSQCVTLPVLQAVLLLIIDTRSMMSSFSACYLNHLIRSDRVSTEFGPM